MNSESKDTNGARKTFDTYYSTPSRIYSSNIQQHINVNRAVEHEEQRQSGRKMSVMNKSSIIKKEEDKFNVCAHGKNNTDVLQEHSDGLSNKTSPIWFLTSLIATILGTFSLTATILLLPIALGGWSIHIEVKQWIIMVCCFIIAFVITYIISGNGKATTMNPRLRVAGTVFVTSLIAMALFSFALVVTRIMH